MENNEITENKQEYPYKTIEQKKKTKDKTFKLCFVIEEPIGRSNIKTDKPLGIGNKIIIALKLDI